MTDDVRGWGEPAPGSMLRRPYPDAVERGRERRGQFATPPGVTFGRFLFALGGIFALVLVGDGFGWDHVSVSLIRRNGLDRWKPIERCPTWEEMCRVRDLFFAPGAWVLQFLPPAADNISHHPYCLHLWAPQQASLPTPTADHGRAVDEQRDGEPMTQDSETMPTTEAPLDSIGLPSSDYYDCCESERLEHETPAEAPSGGDNIRRLRNRSCGVSAKHPANRGLVVLSAWVEPALREHVRMRASEAGIPVSEWIASALRRECASQSMRAIEPEIAARLAASGERKVD